MKNIGYSFNGFTTARLKRFLSTGGQEFTFIETERNEYGEPTETVSSSVLIFGVLHKSSSSGYDSAGSVTSSAGSKVRSHPGVSIMTSWESLFPGYSGGKDLSPGMFIEIDNTKYKIIKTSNLNDWGIVADVFLEEFDEWEA